MYNFPYVESYEKLDDLFEAIVNHEVPDKFTYRYLAEIGFASSKDRDMLPALKILGFIDSKGHPTNLYRELRDPGAYSQSLRLAVDKAYISLFNEYPNAADVSENVSEGYFRKLTEESRERGRVYQRTFEKLLRLAEYGKQDDQDISDKLPSKVSFQENEEVGEAVRNINLNINLPTTTDEKVYEALFKHLKELLTH